MIFANSLYRFDKETDELKTPTSRVVLSFLDELSEMSVLLLQVHSHLRRAVVIVAIIRIHFLAIDLGNHFCQRLRKEATTMT